MNRLSASLLAASLAFSGSAVAQTSGYYSAGDDGYDRPGDYAGQDATYDYARVLRVDPVIGSQYGNSNARNPTQCRYREADDVYTRSGYGQDDGYGRNEDYRGDDYQGRNNDYRNDGTYRNDSNQTGRTVATVIGGIAGAVLGSKVGDGSGRYVGTAVGSMVGGMAGRSIYDSSRRSQQVSRRGTVRVCDPLPAYGDGNSYRDDDERLDGYDVTYEYANRTYHTRTHYHPGERIRVRVDVQPE